MNDIVRALRDMGVILEDGSTLPPPVDIDWTAFSKKLERQLIRNGVQVQQRGWVGWNPDHRHLVVERWHFVGRERSSWANSWG